jgi:hypothetical protein
MCEQCSAETKSYGEVVPGWSLHQATKDGNFMKKGDFGLINYNDPSIIWPGHLVPIKDPSFEMTPEQLDLMTEEQDIKFYEFHNLIYSLRPFFECDPVSGYSIIYSMLQSGFNPEKHKWMYLDWLVHKMALLIESNHEET